MNFVRWFFICTLLLCQIKPTDEFVVPVAKEVIKTIIKKGIINSEKSWARKIKDERKNNNGQNNKEKAKNPGKDVPNKKVSKREVSRKK